MGINIRTKGAGAEREVAKALNLIIWQESEKAGLDPKRFDIAQRNQNQSASGGADLVGVFGLSIEIKRQEALSIGSWWAQCIASAQRECEVPVLLFRQSHKAWRCILMGYVEVCTGQRDDPGYMGMRCEISWEDFLIWFREHVRRKLSMTEA